MATLLVRYFYKKHKARKTADDQPEESARPSQSTPQSASNNNAAASTSAQNSGENQKENISLDSQNTKSGLKWKLTLMGALLIPIFLETLDYTGKFDLSLALVIPNQ
jgi:hypothetical protein